MPISVGNIRAGRDVTAIEAGGDVTTAGPAEELTPAVRAEIAGLTLQLQSHLNQAQPDRNTIKALLGDLTRLAPKVARTLIDVWRNPLQALGGILEE